MTSPINDNTTMDISTVQTSDILFIPEIDINQLIKIMDIHGRLTKAIPNTPLLYIYSDGSIEKRIFIL